MFRILNQHIAMTRRTDTHPAPSKELPSRSRPVATLRLGRIKAAIWENPVEGRKFYNVTFTRTYRDEQKQFHDTSSFGRDDLPLVAKLADEAHTYIFKRLSGEKGTEPE